MTSKRSVPRHFALVLSAVAMSNAACVEWIGDQGILLITEAEPVAISGCSPPASANFGVGVLDLLTEVPYEANLRVVLNLPATFNTNRVTQEPIRQPGWQNYGNTDSNTVIVDGVEVFFIDGRNGDPLTNAGRLPTEAEPRISPASGVIFNTQQSLSATDVFPATAITGEEAQILRNGRIGSSLSPTTKERIVANMRFRGYTTGGARIRSSEFALPIDLCRGCLFPAESLPDGVCPAGTVLTNAACSPAGQDTPLTCE
jgi:hypothetical protein